MISFNKNIIPFFSVIICTYNREEYLVRAIESLIRQTDDDWECIIIDDGSNDGTFNKIKPYVDNSQKFKYLYHQNHGIAFSRNAGIQISSGLFVTFLDSDDEYKENHLKIRRDLLEENKQLDLLHGGVEIIGNHFVPDLNDKSKLIHLDDCAIGGTFFIKREKANEIGGFENVKYGDDKLFFEKAIANNFKIVKTDIPTYIYYRDTPDSLCNNIYENKNES